MIASLPGTTAAASAQAGAAAATGGAASAASEAQGAASPADAFAALMAELAGDGADEGLASVGPAPKLPALGADTTGANGARRATRAGSRAESKESTDGAAQTSAATNDRPAGDTSLAVLLAMMSITPPDRAVDPSDGTPAAAPAPASADAIGADAPPGRRIDTNAAGVRVDGQTLSQASVDPVDPSVWDAAFDAATAGVPPAGVQAHALDSKVAQQLHDLGIADGASGASNQRLENARPQVDGQSPAVPPPSTAETTVPSAPSTIALALRGGQTPIADSAVRDAGSSSLPASSAVVTGPSPVANRFSGDTGSPAGSFSSAPSTADATAAPSARTDRAAQTFARAVEVHIGTAVPTVANADVKVAPAPPAAAAVPDDLSSQIVQGVRMLWRDGAGDARITLQPEYLGAVTISLHVEQGGVTAVLDADLPAVRTWLETNQPLLSHALADHGLTLERLVVGEPPPAGEGRAQEDEPRQRQDQPRRHRQRADDGMFEITL